MSDEVDQAAEKAETLFNFKLAEARHKAQKRELQPTGRCHYCEEEVGGSLLWCNSGCREDWEYLKERRMIK